MNGDGMHSGRVGPNQPLRYRRIGVGAEPAVSSRQPRVRVLVADDSSCARSALSSLILTVPGTKVIATASNGVEAVRLARNLRPDVVLLDVRMPVMDGLEATRCIKADRAGTLVIVQSMCAAYRSAAISAGADAFFVKGESSDDLVEAIVRRRMVVREPSTRAPRLARPVVGSHSSRRSWPDPRDTRALAGGHALI